jgi:cytochrome P450
MAAAEPSASRPPSLAVAAPRAPAGAAASGRLPPGPCNGLTGWRHVRRLRTELLESAVALQREYGDLLTWRIGPVRFYQISHPDMVGELLVKQATSLIKSRVVRWYFQRWMGRGLLLNEGPPWHEQRRKVRWSMQQTPPQAHAPVVVRQARDLLAAHAGSEVDLAAGLDRLAFYLNVRALLGADAEPALEPLYDAANEVHSTGIAELVSLNVLPDWLPLPSKVRLRQAIRRFDEVLLPLAARRRAAGTPGGDLLSWMLVAEDRQAGTCGMSDRQARDEVVNLLMGGKETVGASLTWSCYLLACHPEEQELAAGEARAALAGRDPLLEDFPRLGRVQCVIKEAMRLYPPVYSLAREAIAPVEVGGYRLPRGSQLQVPVYAIHHDERWFAEPERFDSQRFSGDREAALPRYAYLPFGAGPRSCVGKQLGYDQCVLVLAWLLSNYHLRLAPGQGPPRLATDIVLHPRDPLRFVLTPRATGPGAA